MKVEISSEAARYIRRETEYFQGSRPEAARQFILAMKKLRQNLQHFPAMGRRTEELPVAGVFRFITGSYLVDYQIARDRVVIIAIRHGREKPPGLETENDFDYES